MQSSNTTTRLEQELKIQASSNFQFKYTAISRPDDFAKKAKILLRLLDLPVLSQSSYRLRDDYYDFEGLPLYADGYALRVREGECQDSHLIVTLKEDAHGMSTAGHTRLEYEAKLTKKEWNSLCDRPEALFKKLNITIMADVNVGDKLRYLGSIRNRRTNIVFETIAGRWKMSYDLYFFGQNPVSSMDDFTRYFCELEFELQDAKGTDQASDAQLMKLLTAFRELFGLEDSKYTKLRRGIEFAWVRKAEFKFVHVMGIDIVAYSTQPPLIQLQLVQKLNKFVKDALSNTRSNAGYISKDDFTVYIPTGDGMYLVFEHDEEANILLPMLANLKRLVDGYNDSLKDKSRHIKYRIAIHSGPVFKYSDINENLNYAGNGINLAARVLGQAKDGQVLVSSAFKEFLESSGGTSAKFEDEGQKTVKHGVSIHVWNCKQLPKCSIPSSPKVQDRL